MLFFLQIYSNWLIRKFDIIAYLIAENLALRQQIIVLKRNQNRPRIKEPVELFKILKFEGVVASGGEAKSVISDGKVLVNAGVETRKRKKIVSEDTIEFKGQKFRILLKS
jgi:ribosome-associated protein